MIQKLYNNKKITRLGNDTIYNKLYKGNALVYEGINNSLLNSSSNSISFPTTGGTITLNIASNDTWNITNIPAWASFSQSSGMGNASITIEVNTTPTADRQANVTISTVSRNVTINLKQYVIHYVTDIYYSNYSTKCPIEIPIYSTNTLKWRIKGKWKQMTGDMVVGSSTGNDNNDYRFFYVSNLTYLDIGNKRKKAPLIPFVADTLIDYTITNLNIYDNINQRYIINGDTFTGDLVRDTMKWYVNYLSLMEWQLWEGETLVFNGKAVEQSGQGGIYDEISGNFYTNNNYTISYNE